MKQNMVTQFNSSNVSRIFLYGRRMLLASILLLSLLQKPFDMFAAEQPTQPDATDISTILPLLAERIAKLDVATQPYSFLNHTYNDASLNHAGMQPLYTAWDELVSGKRDHFVIVHIGDSHIRSGFYPGVVQHGLQSIFGDAGSKKGLVKESVSSRGKTTVKSKTHRIKSGDTLSGIAAKYGTSVTKICKLNRGLTKNTTLRLGKIITISRSTKRVKVKGTPITTTVDSLRFEDTGVHYITSGINGATYTHYNQNESFWTNLKRINPDMVIISLGTNDSMGRYQSSVFEQQFAKFRSRMSTELPNTFALYTTPPDCVKKGKSRSMVDNPDIASIRDAMQLQLSGTHAAYWDLYEAMGGKASIRTWKKNCLTHYDLIHFNVQGYELQGKLLLQALLKGYSAHVGQQSTR